MNTSNKISIKITALVMSMTLFSLAGFSKSHVTLSLKNIRTSAHTIEYDLYVINDGGSSLRMAGCSFGVNINQAALNGGSITYTFKPNTRNILLDESHKYALEALNDDRVAQARMTTAYTGFERAGELLPNVPVKIGRFIVTNSNEWKVNSQANLSLQETAVKGLTTCYLLGFEDNHTEAIALTADASTLSTQAESCPLLNPALQSDHATANASLREGGAFTEVSNQVSLYPNPAVDVLHVDYYSIRKNVVQIRLFDLQGRLVLQSQSQVNEGSNNVSLPLQSLTQGMYFIHIADQENFHYKQSFLKQ